MAGDKAGVIYWYVVSALSRDLSAQTLEGGPLMPALAELAQGAVRFESALACSGDSFLSTASMLTGKWPSRLGLTDCRVRVMGRGLEQLGGLDSAHATLPAWLAKQGFDTFSHPDSLTPFPGDGLEQGFTHPKAMPQALEEDRSIFIWHQAKGCRLPLEPTGLARRALGLEDQADQQGLYLAAAFDADRALARDLGELAQAGLWDRALIVVTSDCGPGPAPGQGDDRPTGLHGRNLAVPLFIKFPADHPLAAHHGRMIKTRAGLADLAPTLALAGAGQDMPDADGRSLLPVISGEDREHRDLVAFRSVLEQDKQGPVKVEALAAIKGTRKALGGFRPDGREIRELFDLAVDPGETENLADREPELYEELMIWAASAAMPGVPAGQDQASAMDEDEKAALAEKLRSLGYL